MGITIGSENLNNDFKTSAEAKRQLILASFIFANEIFMEGQGHISVRNPENPDTFFHASSLSSEFIGMNDVMEIGLDGCVVSGHEGKKPSEERTLHARVFAGRNDVHCVFHGCPQPLVPFYTISETQLLPVMSYGSIFHNGFAYYDASEVSGEMTVNSPDEGDNVVRTLGDKWACLIRDRGAVTCAESIPQLALDTILLVKSAEVQLECNRLGVKPKLCTKDEAVVFRNNMHSNNSLARYWEYFAVRAIKAMSGIDDVKVQL